MSDNIPPYEIQLEIIKRVSDVKSLIRLRSVSKPWKSFIDSSEFIAGYGVRDTQPHRLLLSYKTAGDPRKLNYVSFADDDVSFPQQQQQLDFAPNVPLLVKQLYKSTVIGSSCGLWCLYGVHGSETQQEMLVIWNPSIRKAVGVVVPRELNNFPGKIIHFGFGVCPSTYDPTIVGISRSFHGKFKVGIFTLSSKTWKMIPTSVSMPWESIRLRSSTQVAIDRFIFWVANAYGYKNFILSFDLITHEFKEINLPRSLENPFSLEISISELNESLVVAEYTSEVNGRVYGVWMMGEEGGAMTSFKKIFTINTPGSVVDKVLGYKKSGEPIV
ncbi:putative F-box domain-containing protein, partial [Tanacetum coccineum]